MATSRSRPNMPVHFAPGPSGTLRWMGYWLASRVQNAARTLRARWTGDVRPALDARRADLTSRARGAIERAEAEGTTTPYASLAAAVRDTQRGRASNVSAAA